jgi:hypothetical protein
MSLTACGFASDDTRNLDPSAQRMIPTGAPVVALKPREGQPAGTREVTGKFFSMYVPANFQEKSALMDNGDRKVGFDAPSSKPATPVRVAVAPDTDSKATAIEQTYALELIKKGEGVKDLTRSMVKWPGAQNAVLLQWTETRAGAVSTDEPERNWQLSAQVNDNLIVSVIAFAPAGEFETAGLAKIMETFRPHA